MNRRHFIAAAMALAATPLLPAFAAAPPAMRTRWNVIESEGYDAIAFLGALSGQELYRHYYAEDADAFAPGLPEEIRADIPRLAQEAEAESFGLLWPVLANILSGAGITSLQSVIDALADPDGRVAEQFNLVFLTGWAPDPSQPVPAKRGSATASLAEALKPKPEAGE